MEQFQSKFSLKVTPTNYPVVKITNSKDTFMCVLNYYGDDILIYETAYLLLLNNANETLGYVKLSQGGISGTVIDVRLVLKYAIESLATAVILIHNHPSGKLIASDADKNITKKVREALKTIEIVLLDHLIVTSVGFLSFADEGLLTY